jgi:hypothetical protein
MTRSSAVAEPASTIRRIELGVDHRLDLLDLGIVGVALGL